MRGTPHKAEGPGDQKVIQPLEDLLFTGEILKYPEFDLFGYLITSTTPQNFRIAPVKISHAVSLTPFNYDSLFNANIGLANRLRKTVGDMKPNPFTSEEHMTYYLYSITVDIDQIGQIESYFQLKGDDKKNLTVKIDGNYIILSKIQKNAKENEKFKFKLENNDNIILEEIVLPIKKDDLLSNINEDILNKFKFNPDAEVLIVKYSYKNINERVEKLIKAILNLHRQIKGRDEDLSPKLLVLGLYKDKPYKTYKDKIILADEYVEEEYDEIEEKGENGKIVRKVIHKITKSKKPVFKMKDISATCELLSDTENLWKRIEEKLFKSNDKEIEDVSIFYTPDIEVRLED